jgi:hypothetical protein
MWSNPQMDSSRDPTFEWSSWAPTRTYTRGSVTVRARYIGCVGVWSPLLTKEKPQAGMGIAPKELGMVKRGSSLQGTYYGISCTLATALPPRWRSAGGCACKHLS